MSNDTKCAKCTHDISAHIFDSKGGSICVGCVCPGYEPASEAVPASAPTCGQKERDMQLLEALDNSIVYYGPHACANCGRTICKSGNGDNRFAFDYPEGPIYPNTNWVEHRCEQAAPPAPATDVRRYDAAKRDAIAQAMADDANEQASAGAEAEAARPLNAPVPSRYGITAVRIEGDKKKFYWQRNGSYYRKEIATSEEKDLWDALNDARSRCAALERDYAELVAAGGSADEFDNHADFVERAKRQAAAESEIEKLRLFLRKFDTFWPVLGELLDGLRNDGSLWSSWHENIRQQLGVLILDSAALGKE